MLNLMLVDDESDVRSRVLNNVDWAQLGYKIVCEAENGKEAYELFEKYVPDVVITDIKMPFMNGLELTEKILSKYPYTKIIILTGFDEFEYAKKGISLQVEDYVLKPISKNELTKILINVKNKIEEEKSLKKNVDDLKGYYKSTYKLVIQRCLENILEGASKSEIDEWIDYYNLDIRGELFSVLYINIDNEESYEDLETINLKRMSLLRFLDDLKESLALGEYFFYDNSIFIIQSCYEKDESFFLKKLDFICNNILQGVSRYLDVTVTIGVGEVVSDSSEIYFSKESALRAYDYKIMLGSNKIIFVNDIEYKNTNPSSMKNIDVRRISTFIRTGQIETFNEYLQKIFVEIINDKENKHMTLELQIFGVLVRIIDELDLSDKKIDELKESVLISISKQESHEEIKRGLLLLAKRIDLLGSVRRKDLRKGIVGKAKEIVASMIKSPELSVELIAEKMHYSPNYLSSTFKKEIGKSLNSYILELRIEEAKELLVNSELKSSDIAMETGFSSSSYFAFSFKKAVGISPREYRKSKRK